MGALGPLAVLAALAAGPAPAGPIGRWDGHIAEASARFGVPRPWIEQVILAESGGRDRTGNRPIRSPAGAMGLMQLMPGTWRDMRQTYGLGPDPDDPRENILAGTAYLRSMYDRFGYPGLFAAYHAGPTRYEEYLRSGRALPSETLAYVASVSRRAPGHAPAGSGKPDGSDLFIARSGPVAAGSPQVRLAPDSLFVQLGRR